MNLKQLAAEKILGEVLRPLKDVGRLKILVVDPFTKEMLSACCTMSDVTAEGIATIEDLMKSREPLPSLEAIYFLSPSHDTEARTFSSLRPAPDALLNNIAKSTVMRSIKTCKELGLAYIPYEAQVFTLHLPDTMPKFFPPQKSEDFWDRIEMIADRLALLCVAVGDIPSISYREAFTRNIELAHLVENKLSILRKENPSLGAADPEKIQPGLIILDRGYDLTTPLLHELTVQGMVHDLLPVDRGVYMYQDGNENPKKMLVLDENNEEWMGTRHSHIADASKLISGKLKDLAVADKETKRDTLKDLSSLIRTAPEQKKKLDRLAGVMYMIEQCMARYSSGVDLLCQIEQDLATGADTHGEPLKDAQRMILGPLADPKVRPEDRLRLLLLYIQYCGGVTQDGLQKLVKHAQFRSTESDIIKNIENLGLTVVSEFVQSGGKLTARRERPSTPVYNTSRWVPLLKDILEDALDETMDQNVYPHLPGKRVSISSQVPMSARYGQWHKKKPDNALSSGPRLIVYIIGGMTYSEMRTVYEVSRERNCSILIGSDQIITPDSFLNELAAMNRKSALHFESFIRCTVVDEQESQV
ncbi:unnamed protein product, partial [Mesorhabditis spiculigera]